MKFYVLIMLFGGLFSAYLGAATDDPAVNQLIERDPAQEMYIGSYIEEPEEKAPPQPKAPAAEQQKEQKDVQDE